VTKPVAKPKTKPATKPVTTPEPAQPPDQPPCPGSVDGPPGHTKSAQPDRPCKGDGNEGKGKKDGNAKGGFVLVLPPLAGTFLRIRGHRALRPLRRRRRTR
jgi:hypothetical protein